MRLSELGILQQYTIKYQYILIYCHYRIDFDIISLVLINSYNFCYNALVGINAGSVQCPYHEWNINMCTLIANHSYAAICGLNPF